ncbi:hypothetical protein ANCCAN_02297 [Ancylostoma caninum]|uniref:Uncharacterized protein n=1 Tax=Ancylostoma caninum TaxID=29170 RepID=A0A368H7N6_ANCCA|nr:hypothetical protein ANCCAN_02297 [Ancylostoma caninum]
MASASTSSESSAPDEELVRDAALCLRSFHGSKDFIPYSKFCDRFKKNSGYSIKEYLQNCDYTFSDVMEKVSKTTPTKCKYDAEQKMIKLIPEKANTYEQNNYSNNMKLAKLLQLAMLLAPVASNPQLLQGLEYQLSTTKSFQHRFKVYQVLLIAIQRNLYTPALAPLLKRLVDELSSDDVLMRLAAMDGLSDAAIASPDSAAVVYQSGAPQKVRIRIYFCSCGF